MADASQAVTNFLGGEISQYAQGRFDRPDYKISLSTCLNWFPVEIGALVRRPGTQYASHTRAGNPGRVMEFDFEQSSPVTMEFTDGWLRFRNGTTLLTTNDTQTVSAISTANPAVVNTAVANTWATGNTVIFPAGVPLLENRQFTITQIDNQHFSLQDALTGANIDGSTLGTIPAGLTVQRVQELQTNFGAGSWAVSSMRAIQAETTSILVAPTVAPQAVTVASLPTVNANAVFNIGAVTFNDGPYLDPFSNGLQVTPNQKSGIVTMTLSFPTYNSAVAYTKGEFVVSSGVNYVSLQDQNVGNTPASSPAFWSATSIGAAINNGTGLSNADIGRLVRFFSEPSPWSSTVSYTAGNFVSYNPSGVPGAETYWKALVNNTGNTPGTDTTNWSLISTEGAALWTWGKITALSNGISGSTGVNIGNLTGAGGLAAAFDGNPTKDLTASAELGLTFGAVPFGTLETFDTYVGKNYSGGGGQKIGYATIYPSADNGFGYGIYFWDYISGSPAGTFSSYMTTTFTLNLRAKSTLPASPSDGTLLGTITISGNTNSPVTINSSDQSTTWNYVWVELIGFYDNVKPAANTQQTSADIFACIAQLSLFNPVGTSSGASFNAEIIGPSLLYTNLITTWRMGVYGGPNGYPRCGCYHEGRIWLGGAIANRLDASTSNGISGSSINMAPTDQYGVVADSAGISYTVNSDSVNPILSMKPDLQGVLITTQNGELLVQAPTTGPLTPTNIAVRRVTKHGSANIEPIRTPHANIIVQRYSRKLLEYFADVFSGKYSAPNLADKAQHITANGIAEIAYTSSTTPMIWGYDELGSLFSVTYKRDALMTSQPPSFYAWARHTLGTGRIVQSVCAGPSVDGNLDAMTMVTNDASTDIHHVEVLTDIPNETTPFLSSWFLDDAVNPTSVTVGVSSMTVNGLWHLNGKTVQVFAGGLDCGNIGDLAEPFISTFTYSQNQYALGSDLNIYKSVGNKNIGNDPTTDGGVHWTLIGTGLDFVVSNGSITIPYGDGVSGGTGAGLFTQTFASGLSLSQIVVGCTYSSDGQIVRPQTPAETGSRRGPALGMISRDHFFGALLVNTLGIMFGTNFSSMIPARFTKDDEVTALDSLTSFTGLYTDQPDARYSRNSERFCFRVNRPFPAAITAIEVSRATQDQ